MKSPADWAARLAREWQRAELRVERLLSPGAWPLALKIGKPSAALFASDPARVREHVRAWRAVRVGRVHFAPVAYRAGSAPVDMPLHWELRSPSEWLAATGDATLRAEFEALGERVQAIAAADFRQLIVRHKRLVLERPAAEVVKAAELALALQPGCAAGRPLRALSLCNIDSKFIERNRALLAALLDLRFAGQASAQGLEAFLDALDEREHWLLLAPLASGLLPFRQLRVRASELAALPETVSHVLIVENERCLHQLPGLPGTLAILGAGLNLAWLQGDWLSRCRLAYWGDMDTWGLAMLARARRYQPGLQALLMNRAEFDRHAPGRAVPEPVPADATAMTGLLPEEQVFCSWLREQARGRLEQEFLPAARVEEVVREWWDVAPVSLSPRAKG